MMNKHFLAVAIALLIGGAMNVNAQTEGTESKNEKMIRLTKAADENPADWKAQFDVGSRFSHTNRQCSISSVISSGKMPIRMLF